MQKVVGSNPISRFQEARVLSGFLRFGVRMGQRQLGGLTGLSGDLHGQ